MTFTPKFSITNKIANSLTEIERARGFLEAAKLSENWIKEMQGRALILEAHHTTHIEGTELTLEQSEKLMQGHVIIGINPDDKRELLNYKDAFDFVSDYLNTGRPITENLIREIHHNLVSGVRGGAATPGDYRKIQNYVVNSLTKEVIYTPPPVYEIRPMMEDLVLWLNNEQDINSILKAGIGQFQLVHIHPFLDGNGRTARLLSTLYLYKTGYDFKRLFTISEYYDRNRTDYYRAIQSVREKNLDLTFWLEYFCEGLSIQLQEIKKKGLQVIEKDLLVKELGLSKRKSAAIGYVFDNGSITTEEYHSLFPGVTKRTLQREFKELVELGILKSSGARKSIVYRIKKIATQ